MKSMRSRLEILLCCLILTVMMTGCGGSGMDSWTLNGPKDPNTLKRMRISALTEFVQMPDQPGPMQIKAQVELLNGMDQLLKKPGKWRFELYEFHPRSSEPRGPRIIMWPDMDLGSPEIEARYWKEILRGYEFYLPLEFIPNPGKKFILEATYMVEKRRYHNLFKIQYSPAVP